MNCSYLMLVPDKLVIRMIEFIRENNDILIFEAQKFSEVYHDILDECLSIDKNIFNECSVADVSVDTSGCLGQV